MSIRDQRVGTSHSD